MFVRKQYGHFELDSFSMTSVLKIVVDLIYTSILQKAFTKSQHYCQ